MVCTCIYLHVNACTYIYTCMYINIYASDESQFQVCAALVPRIYVCIFVRVKKLKIAALTAKPVLHVTAQLNKSE